MKHIAAYALLVLGGNESPSAADVKKVLTAAGVTADDAKLNELVKAANGKSFQALVADGLVKLSSGGSSGSGAAKPAAAAETKAEKKAEVKKQESEEDMEMGDFFNM